MRTELTTLGGEAISDLCFGTMQFGGSAKADQARAMYDACRAAHINFFDTAPVYNGGASESLLGQLIARERDRVIIATKAAYDEPASAENLRRSVEASRRRLNVDFIDILYLHRWDATTPLHETIETLAALQQQGAIGHIGVSNYAAWQTIKAQAIATKNGTRIACIQPMYNLVKRQAEVEILPMASDQGIAVFPYSPLGGGLLTGKYARSAPEGRLSHDTRYAARYGQEWMHTSARDLSNMAADLEVSAATLAVAWVASNPQVRAPIISARTVAQLKPSLEAAQYAMTPELYDEITALSRTPPPATDRLEEG